MVLEDLFIFTMCIPSTNKHQFSGELVQLGNVVEHIRGVTYKAAEDLSPELCEGYITLLRANNIQDGELNFSDVQYVDRKKVKINQMLKAGDILVCASSGSKNLVGKAALVVEDMDVTFGAFCCVLRPKGIDSGYLSQFFQSPQYRRKIEKSCAGTNINNLRASDFASLEIIDYGENTSIIVEFFNAVDKCIEPAKNQIKQLDNLVKSRFIELFGNPVTNSMRWTTEPINEVAPQKASQLPKGDNVWLLNLDAIESNTGTILEKKRVADDDLTGSVAGFTKEHVLYSKLRPYLNKVVVPDEIGACTTELVCLLPNKEKLNRIYLAYLLRSEQFVAYISPKSSGTKMPRADMKTLRTFEVPLPPMGHQKEFADFVAQVDKSKFAAVFLLNSS